MLLFYTALEQSRVVVREGGTQLAVTREIAYAAIGRVYARRLAVEGHGSLHLLHRRHRLLGGNE